jgi:restriction endonuclease Mrr
VRIPAKVALVDGRQLASLMIYRNIRVKVVASYEVKRVDEDYFSKE